MIIARAISALNVTMTLKNVLRIASVNVTTMRRQKKMTSKEQRDIIEEFMEVFPRAYTVEDTMRLCLRLKVERDQWRNLAMKEHIKFCQVDDHESCVEYLDWRHGMEMREAGWLGQ